MCCALKQLLLVILLVPSARDAQLAVKGNSSSHNTDASIYYLTSVQVSRLGVTSILVSTATGVNVDIFRRGIREHQMKQAA